MAYSYIERAYGKRFEDGQRIRFTEYHGDRANGVVLPEGTHGHYVRVRFDDGHEGNCHPNSLELVVPSAGVTAPSEVDGK